MRARRLAKRKAAVARNEATLPERRRQARLAPLVAEAEAGYPVESIKAVPR